MIDKVFVYKEIGRTGFFMKVPVEPPKSRTTSKVKARSFRPRPIKTVPYRI